MQTTGVPSHHQTDSLDMLQVQRLSTFLLPSSICWLEVMPVHEDFAAILVLLEIVLPADGTLFSAIGALRQEFIL